MSEYSIEKEFIRDAFHSGLLDTGDLKTLERFCQIFTGELEAFLALTFADSWLSEEDAKRLIKIANPSAETAKEYQRFSKLAINGRP